jgi:hypothetical protein
MCCRGGSSSATSALYGLRLPHIGGFLISAEAPVKSALIFCGFVLSEKGRIIRFPELEFIVNFFSL